jgi:exodeoxyribonuclease-3
MLRIISLNLNGIRSAANKGLMPWLARQKADVVCMQEVKAQVGDLAPEMLAPKGYHGYFHCAEKKGYSGVAIYARTKPDRIVEGLGIPEIDREGRFLCADFGNLSVISLYLPSGSSSEERQQVKFRFLELFHPHLKKMAGAKREFIVCGDWNIAHKEIDLRNWRSNRKNSGFLPEERSWLTGVFDDLGWVDVFRRLDQRPDQYTWWSNRGNARENNVGWRIDYQIATPGIAGKAKKTSIYTTTRFSDHAPLTVDYDHTL